MNHVILVCALHYVTVTSFFAKLVIATSNPKLLPFSYPRLYKVADRNFGMDYFSKKLGIENFLTTYTSLKRTKPYMEWRKEFEEKKERLRDIDACSLKKIDPKVRAQDAVSEAGYQKCFEQCKLENKVYFQFLNAKLQKLIKMKSCSVDLRLTSAAVYNKPPKKYFSCSKKAYKKYVCECSYQKYAIKTSEEFNKTFHQIITELYQLSPSPDNCKMLEEKYKTPAKLVAFLISCHLVPTEVFGFLSWWNTMENSAGQKETTTTIATDSTYEESEESGHGWNRNLSDDQEDEEDEKDEDKKIYIRWKPKLKRKSGEI